LRAALREDPDILLVGELRDQETIALALESSNTGSLVMGTLQTATAISTIMRVIDFFPPEQHHHIRSSLADCLRGLISQTLCKRIGGGRVVASEILIVNPAVRHLIHEDKTDQILSIMQTTKAQGNRILNGDLAQLVKGKRIGNRVDKVEYEEALSKTVDPEDLAQRLGKPLPKH
jgi:twitching motility protein PilT